jgi:hypothetical protein
MKLIKIVSKALVMTKTGLSRVAPHTEKLKSTILLH